MNRRPRPVVVDAPVQVDAAAFAGLERRVAALEAERRATRPRQNRSAAATLGVDRDAARARRDAAVILALADAVGDRLFTAHEAIDVGTVSPAVAQALTDARVMAARKPGRRLGRLFERNVGRDVGGVYVDAVGKEHGVVIWRLFATPAKPAKPPDPVASGGRRRDSGRP